MEVGINCTRDVVDRPWVELFYGDFVKKETVLNTFLSFSAYAFVSIIWLSYNTCGEVVQIRTGKRDFDAI